MRQEIIQLVGMLRYRFGQILPLQQNFYRLPYKQYSELAFWRREIQKYIKWYEGKLSSHYGVPAPTEEIRVIEYDLKVNAILTWVKAHINKYLDLLLIPKEYFRGKRILDVGCGPIPYALAFVDCEIFGLDQLISEYIKLGFPLDKYSDHLTYVNCASENIPIKDNFFDAVISVNAIDHVDDFSATAKEISGVL
jgi:2-polyprenyl-3-methyl-5-hydroxy-6-metoxy-1,4-benzoquinol methylase